MYFLGLVWFRQRDNIYVWFDIDISVSKIQKSVVKGYTQEFV
uniref:Uncharacterized protein n=1 Tax=viral metagenome TaxID=1070528 RepID=A0A6C0JUQ0_9ZZZZ